MNILFIGHRYHTVTGSSIFFINLLRKLGEVECLFDDGLDDQSKRKNYAQIVNQRHFDLIIVWQIEYAAYQLRRHKGVVFVPMYDGARGLPLSYWSDLKGIRILCFSMSIYYTAQMAGCRAQYAQYFPEMIPRERTMDFEAAYYWYRRDDLDLGGLQHLVNLLGIKRLNVLYHPDFPTEARISPSEFFERLSPAVELLNWTETKEEQFDAVCQSGYYIASRNFEGIGMAFLEAMSLGSVVVAPENPTYTDYIASGYNGFLYDRCGTIDLSASYSPMKLAKRAELTAARGRMLWTANEDRLLTWLAFPEEPEFQYFSTPLSNDVAQDDASTNAPAAGTKARPVITVATVVRNAVAEFAKTFDSVRSQRGVSFEYLVVDGASTDGTLDAIKARDGGIDKWVSQADSGIYDAMNKAARLATGEFIIFMNAGDEFINHHALASLVAAREPDSDFLIGHHIYVDSANRNVIHRVNDFAQTYARLADGRLSYNWHSGIPGHQATAVRTELLRELRYDVTLDIAADHDFMFRAAAAGAKFSVADAYICRYHGGGHSSTHSFRCVKQWIYIGLKHSRRPKAVWNFYAPQLLSLLAAKVQSSENNASRAALLLQEWWWAAKATKSLPPRLVLSHGKRIAKRLLRRLSAVENAFDLRRDRDHLFTSNMGLSWPEAKGVWTDWPTVHFAFHRRVPSVRQITFEVTQAGPTLAGDRVSVVVNKSRRVEGRLGVGRRVIDLGERTDIDEITLQIPVALSPARAGLGMDERLLGYMIKRVSFH